MRPLMMLPERKKDCIKEVVRRFLADHETERPIDANRL
jgi:hypothetical protein